MHPVAGRVERGRPDQLLRAVSNALACAPVRLLTATRRRPPRDPNGIGRYYQGRQIAHVMGHEGADWLERDDRSQEEGTETLLIKELHLQPTDTVADIGRGHRFFSFRMAPLVPRGQVLAVDIQPK
ncbi:MAG: hypothetical protein WKG07_15595 [Hymenobacter sp.]